tara:strand:- start:241 stop:474 length:234 start_codon:yes stop_codon:yes gene_type:complete
MFERNEVTCSKLQTISIYIKINTWDTLKQILCSFFILQSALTVQNQPLQENEKWSLEKNYIKLFLIPTNVGITTKIK